MTIALDRFCINRKIAPNLDLDSFFPPGETLRAQ